MDAVYDSSSRFLGPLDDVPDVEYEIVKQDVPWNPRELTFKNERGLSSFLCIQSLCRDHGLSIPSDVLAIKVLVKDAVAALGSVL